MRTIIVGTDTLLAMAKQLMHDGVILVEDYATMLRRNKEVPFHKRVDTELKYIPEGRFVK